MTIALTPEASATLKKQLLFKVLELSEAHDAPLSHEILEQASVSLNCPRSLGWALYPGGIPELLECWSKWLDQESILALESMPLKEMRVRERVYWGVRLRLAQMSPWRRTAQKAWRLSLSRPLSHRTADQVWQTVHGVWIHAGDTSTDWNFYTKRTLLSGVYSASLWYWLRDHSPSQEATWVFLEKRIQDVLNLPKAANTLKEYLGSFGQIACQMIFRGPRP